jgi:hypothetical protein
MTLVLWMMVYPMITGLGLVLNPFLKDQTAGATKLRADGDFRSGDGIEPI